MLSGGGAPVRGLTPEQAITLSAQGQQGLGTALTVLQGQQQERRARESLPSEIAMREAQTAQMEETTTASRLQREFEHSPEGQALRQAEQEIEQMKAQASLLKSQAEMAKVPAAIATADARVAEAEQKAGELRMLQNTMKTLNDADATINIQGQEVPLSMTFVNPAAFQAVSSLTAKPGTDQIFAQALVDLGYTDSLLLANQMLKTETPLEVLQKALIAKAGSITGVTSKDVEIITDAMDTLLDATGGSPEEQAAAERVVRETEEALGRANMLDRPFYETPSQ